MRGGGVVVLVRVNWIQDRYFGWGLRTLNPFWMYSKARRRVRRYLIGRVRKRCN